MAAILMDTHVLVWEMEGMAPLGSASKTLTEEARGSDELLISTVSFWEVAMLYSKGRIQLGHPLRAWRRHVLESGIVEIPVSGQLGIDAGLLSDMHGDPADRIITATALDEGATLMTADRQLLGWPGTLARHDART